MCLDHLNTIILFLLCVSYIIFKCTSSTCYFHICFLNTLLFLLLLLLYSFAYFRVPFPLIYLLIFSLVPFPFTPLHVYFLVPFPFTHLSVPYHLMYFHSSHLLLTSAFSYLLSVSPFTRSLPPPFPQSSRLNLSPHLPYYLAMLER